MDTGNEEITKIIMPEFDSRRALDDILNEHVSEEDVDKAYGLSIMRIGTVFYGDE